MFNSLHLIKEEIMKKSKNAKRIIYLTTAALMAALTAVATSFIKFNTGINEGYLHFGDAMIYLSAAILPPPFAFVSSAIGGALADIIAGAPVWAPATAIIKGLNTLPISLLFYFSKKKDRIITPLTCLMSVASGFITVFGYLLAEGLMYSFPSAWTSVPFSIIQATGSTVVFILLGLGLDALKFKKRFFSFDIPKPDSDILYIFEDTPYLNITNKCPCACTFCIRQNGKSLGSAENLWLNKDPDFSQIKATLDAFDFTDVKEIVFCGYGEPTCAYDNLIKACKYIKKKHKGVKIRINTNGLSDLINKKPTAKAICENADIISVSLNAPDAQTYNSLCNPKFGDESFDAVINFIKDCKKYCDDVRVSAVNVLNDEEINKCKKLADELGVKLRIREKV